MKLLGYFVCLVAVLVGLHSLADSYLPSATVEAIWTVLNVVVVLTLAVCVILGVRQHIQEGSSSAMLAGTLLSVFAFLIFTETWILYVNETEISGLDWLWADAVAIIALLRTGTGLLAEDQAAPSS